MSTRWGAPPLGHDGATARAVIRRLDALAVPEETDADVMATVAVCLARTIDAATDRGQAASVTNASRELRETLTRISAEMAPPPEDDPVARAEEVIARAMGRPDVSPFGTTPSMLG